MCRDGVGTAVAVAVGRRCVVQRVRRGRREAAATNTAAAAAKTGGEGGGNNGSGGGRDGSDGGGACVVACDASRRAVDRLRRPHLFLEINP